MFGLFREKEVTDSKSITKEEAISTIQDKWPELKSESYKKWKDKQGKGSDANLVLNGDLEEELLKCLNNAISSASVRSGIHFKIESEYAARHNFGTEGMPKRQFIGATKELEEHLTIIATEEAQKILNSI